MMIVLSTAEMQAIPNNFPEEMQKLKDAANKGGNLGLGHGAGKYSDCLSCTLLHQHPFDK